MSERLKKRRRPITLLCESQRFGWMVAAPLTALFLGIAIVVLRTQFRGLTTRLSTVASGMTRQQVEDIFGPPVLFSCNGQPGMGGVVVWVAFALPEPTCADLRFCTGRGLTFKTNCLYYEPTGLRDLPQDGGCEQCHFRMA